MLQRVSRADYLECLFEGFADECARSSGANELERELDLRRILSRTVKNDGDVYLVVRFLIVPDDYVKASIGRRPYQHVR